MIPAQSVPVHAVVAANRRFLVLAFFFSCFVNALALTGPLFMLQVYDRVLGAQSVETLVALTILVAGLFIFMGLLDGVRSILLTRFGANLHRALTAPVFIRDIGEVGTGDKSHSPASGLQDLQTVREYYGSPTFSAFFDLIWSPLFFLSLFVFHPTIGWLGLVSGAILVGVAALNQAFTHRRTITAGEQGRGALEFARQAQKSRELVLTQGMLGNVIDLLDTQGDRANLRALSARQITGSFSAMTKALRLFLQSLMLAVGAYFVLQAEMTAGAMIAGSILLSRALQPIETLLSGWMMIQQGRQAWRRVRDRLTNPADRRVQHLLTHPDPRLIVAGVLVSTPGDRTPVLGPVGFDLSAGQALGVIGKSGSGKTSLGRAVVGFWPSRVGEIRLGGATLDQFDADALGRLIGYLPQEITLLPGTIAQNIARMSPDPCPGDVERAARRAFAHDMILGLPQGYDTVVDGMNIPLSGGQLQRIGLARALFGKPILLVLDEPNSALDAEGTSALNAAVQEFKDTGRMVILMTHRPTAIERCDKLLVLENGRQKAFGPRGEILKQVLHKPVQVAS